MTQLKTYNISINLPYLIPKFPLRIRGVGALLGTREAKEFYKNLTRRKNLVNNLLSKANKIFVVGVHICKFIIHEQ